LVYICSALHFIAKDMQMDKSFEKRKYDRLKTEHFSIRYKLIDTEQEYIVNVLNISPQGICFIRNSIVQKNDIVLFLFPFKAKKMIIKGKIVRIEGREVAAEFLEKDEKIDDFVRLFNEEYRSIVEKNKMLKKERENPFSKKYNYNYSEPQRLEDDEKMFDV
jgi:hypothetical protein